MAVKSKKELNKEQLLNRRMWLSTVIHIIFLPLNFITSLLGVNLGGIPGATYKYGFLILVCILCTLAVTVTIMLIFKDWI